MKKQLFIVVYYFAESPDDVKKLIKENPDTIDLDIALKESKNTALHLVTKVGNDESKNTI